ncbi:MAG: cobalt transport protein [Cyanobacteria bacterium QH_8_48_120]|jgi:cobalt/nickel transport protein|nr:MAG: cobalt transport protein [Cyanobacteria bacterium QH_1_48_107]PSO58838.1 MAG: cobalt transport protein [Cyanobacteria bacterium QH_10_48_56]PSO59576.1 MAG: cobalt transport protein [Cyanobacteria bacterium QH_7_48_89]PSO65396.1 MAG: cobalt transport protein [Cyanobacteria bacterium QH_6_48_35]PSO65656.1 MAG: cobalt transport protein [Cyanobacteria bacterium QH_2_48_84]PSO68280.1 MAG: cobalt transport protein [Cyanobacteria bacterium QS_1_48_34]PSO70340.1 MAG: cobalt transport protein 
MSRNTNRGRNRALIIVGLGIALLIAVFASPLASSNLDGLERVAENRNFANEAAENAPAQQLPFANIFEGYALKGVPEGIATPLAGLLGTLAAFGLAWGFGKLVVRRRSDSSR